MKRAARGLPPPGLRVRLLRGAARHVPCAPRSARAAAVAPHGVPERAPAHRASSPVRRCATDFPRSTAVLGAAQAPRRGQPARRGRRRGVPHARERYRAGVRCVARRDGARKAGAGLAGAPMRRRRTAAQGGQSARPPGRGDRRGRPMGRPVQGRSRVDRSRRPERGAPGTWRAAPRRSRIRSPDRPAPALPHGPMHVTKQTLGKAALGRIPTAEATSPGAGWLRRG